MVSGFFVFKARYLSKKEVKKMSTRGFETLAIHTGQETPDSTTKAGTTPIF